MRLTAVIGANYGDEGKGLLTDYLCSASSRSLVVRFNGGSNAGHTVVTPSGKRHVFGHFGAGVFAGAPTYLSRHFITNPLCWEKEARELGTLPRLFIHPESPVTTPWDMLFNRRLEESRVGRHGTCGLGIWETVNRERSGVSLRVKDLPLRSFRKKLKEIEAYYGGRALTFNLDQILVHPALLNDFERACRGLLLAAMPKHDLPSCDNLVFEGAQGLLLDELNEENRPHVTGSRTGMFNVLELCDEYDLRWWDLEPIYVTRSYLTRHGHGPLPNEDEDIAYYDNTNVDNDWQKHLRFAPLDTTSLLARVFRDSGDLTPSLAITHLDQCEFPEPENLIALSFPHCYASRGPTREHVKLVNEVPA